MANRHAIFWWFQPKTPLQDVFHSRTEKTNEDEDRELGTKLVIGSYNMERKKDQLWEIIELAQTNEVQRRERTHTKTQEMRERKEIKVICKQGSKRIILACEQLQCILRLAKCRITKSFLLKLHVPYLSRDSVRFHFILYRFLPNTYSFTLRVTYLKLCNQKQCSDVFWPKIVS